MHPHTGVGGEFRVNLVCDQMQRDFALNQECGKRGVGLVHPTVLMKSARHDYPGSRLCSSAMHSDTLKTTSHTAKPEVGSLPEPQP
jgi:hypothetical protein